RALPALPPVRNGAFKVLPPGLELRPVGRPRGAAAPVGRFRAAHLSPPARHPASAARRARARNGGADFAAIEWLSMGVRRGAGAVWTVGPGDRARSAGARLR